MEVVGFALVSIALSEDRGRQHQRERERERKSNKRKCMSRLVFVSHLIIKTISGVLVNSEIYHWCQIYVLYLVKPKNYKG